MRRRFLARSACRRFLTALLSGFALAAGGRMVTGCAPSVAIFVEATASSGEAGALDCSGAVAGASFAGAATGETTVAIFVSSVGAG